MSRPTRNTGASIKQKRANFCESAELSNLATNLWISLVIGASIRAFVRKPHASPTDERTNERTNLSRFVMADRSIGNRASIVVRYSVIGENRWSGGRIGAIGNFRGRSSTTLARKRRAVIRQPDLLPHHRLIITRIRNDAVTR